VVTTRAPRRRAGRGHPAPGSGEHRLKDLAPEWLLAQVERPAAERLPGLRTLDATRNNLPPQLTSLWPCRGGRAAGLLAKTRLLTLTGPGGTGKTRLSLALAGDCVERYPDGTWFVPLAAVTEPDLVASAIAASIGLLSPQRPPIDRVRDHLRDRTALLVLDNFEQVVAGAPVVSELLQAAPKLTVIVSSRAPLRIRGEQEFSVPPLALPAPGTSAVEELMASEAVRLFVERAMAVRPDFVLTADNGPHVAEVLRRLDGLPLTIELAAARFGSCRRRRWPTPRGQARAGGGGRRDLPDRQRTLRGAIDWSHDLLDPDDRRLFARLGVFAGGGPLETAEAVCGIDGDDAPLDVLGGLERLAEQSLLRVEPDLHEDGRFQMLETIREYALEKLEARGETAALRDRHADAFLAFVEAASTDGRGLAAQARWLDRLGDEHDNLRAALDHLVAAGDTTRAAELVYRIWRFWQMRGHLVEARSRVAAVLAMPAWTREPSLARLRALEAAGGLAYWAGDFAAASAPYGEAVTVARALGDERELANALYNSFFARRSDSDADAWIAGIAHPDRSSLDQALAIWTRLGDLEGLGKAYWALAEHHAYRREFEAAEAASTRSLEIFEQLDNRFWIAWARFTRAFGRVLEGRIAGAAADIRVTLREFQATGDLSGVVLIMSSIAGMLLLAGRSETERAGCRQPPGGGRDGPPHRVRVADGRRAGARRRHRRPEPRRRLGGRNGVAARRGDRAGDRVRRRAVREHVPAAVTGVRWPACRPHGSPTRRSIRSRSG
jgi:predicted ATPase